MPYDFLFTFVTYKSTNSWLGKKYYSLECPANQDKNLDRHYISVSWTGTKLGLIMYFVNKQLTYFIKNLRSFGFFIWFCVCRSARVCAGLHGCARVRLGMRRCVQVYLGVRRCAWVCAGMHGYARVCAWVRADVCRCVWICTGVDMCVGWIFRISSGE